MKKLLLVASIMGAFLMPKFHLRTMQVVWVDKHPVSDYVSVMDCNGDVFGIWADGLENGNQIIALTLGEGKSAQILDYTIGR